MRGLDGLYRGMKRPMAGIRSVFNSGKWSRNIVEGKRG